MAGGKQLAGLHADAFERLAVARTAGVAAVGGWSHTAMLPECRRNARTSLSVRRDLGSHAARVAATVCDDCGRSDQARPTGLASVGAADCAWSQSWSQFTPSGIVHQRSR